MLHITIDGPKEDEKEGTVCIIDLRRDWPVSDKGITMKVFSESFMVKTTDYNEALKSAMEVIKRKKLCQHHLK